MQVRALGRALGCSSRALGRGAPALPRTVAVPEPSHRIRGMAGARTTQTGGLVSRDISGDCVDFSVGQVRPLAAPLAAACRPGPRHPPTQLRRPQPNPDSLPLPLIAEAAAHRLQGPAADRLILQ
jgi:hypothetical protein